MRKRLSDKQRFFAKVDKTKTCWIWTASRSGGRGKNQYGQFYAGGRSDYKNWYAHRYSYVIHKGEIPKTLEVMHKCDNKLCVNPEHLELGTRKKNMEDASKRGRLKPYDRKGEKNSNSKLSEKQVKEIIKLLNEGYTQQSIADEYGVGQTTISDIKLLKRWT